MAFALEVSAHSWKVFFCIYNYMINIRALSTKFPTLKVPFILFTEKETSKHSLFARRRPREVA